MVNIVIQSKIIYLSGVKGDKQVAFIEEQAGCLNWETKRLSFLRDKQVTLIGGQTDCPF